MLLPQTYRIAMELIQLLGPEFAEDHANERKLDVMGEHDGAGAEMWRQVLLTIREIVRHERSRSDAEH